jgi:type IV pilus assembly protein PilM
MGLFGSNQVVGIDLGHASIKVVGLSVGKNPKVVGFAEMQVPPKSLDKESLENPAEAAAALKDALKMATPRAIKAKEAYLSVSESLVFRKIMEVPRNVSEAELPTVVRAAVVEFLPDDIESLELDYHPLPTPKEAVTQQVMVVAVNKKVVEQYLAVAKMAGLVVCAIDPKPSALLRAVIGPKVTEPIVIANVGAEMSTLALCADQVVWVASTVPTGGDSLKNPDTGQVDEEKREEKLKRLVSSLADELDHVVKFYANRGSGTAAAIKEVRLVGSGSLIQGIEAALAMETGLKISLGQPLISVPEHFDRRFMGAMGSALYPMFESL